jgi:hypothetical protein
MGGGGGDVQKGQTVRLQKISYLFQTAETQTWVHIVYIITHRETKKRTGQVVFLLAILKGLCHQQMHIF